MWGYLAILAIMAEKLVYNIRWRPWGSSHSRGIFERCMDITHENHIVQADGDLTHMRTQSLTTITSTIVFLGYYVFKLYSKLTYNYYVGR